MTFKDHFSDRAKLYSQYRPEYPEALFQWASSLIPDHKTVWDCATGNGQAAKALARHFDRVIATDASAAQIRHAEPDPRIEYRVATADASGLPDHSVDMVTVAQALHWLDLDSFYVEVRRVLKPGMAIVIWGYGDPLLETEPLQTILHGFNRGTLEEYWRPERLTLLERYANVPFPFREIRAPQMNLEREWTLAEFTGYMGTWSATENYRKQTKTDPIPAVELNLAGRWGGNERRRFIKWPLHIRAGYAD